ncbi:MAG: hypothetical protein NTZ87_00180 [Candidatus Nomurabacteria bacterium]|nr:hypothetical protein [Candidatus Nomurabacteria bacterium]
MQDYFSKPSQNLAPGEYNKVSSYQLGLLSYAGILEQVNNRPKKYKIKKLEALEYMSVNDLNASKFLTEYTEKFLSDNGLITYFQNYKNNPNQANHLIAKDKYWEWAKINTAVKGTDPKHTYRVFNKIFNVYCYKHRIPGEDGSNVTDGPCPYSFLIYNRTNFRDENMPTGMTRREYTEKMLSDINTNGVVEVVLVQKAKAEIKRKYNGESEIQDVALGFIPNGGVHIHHILPQSTHRQFALYRENLIALTPGQHFSSAHVQGNTQRVDPIFQKTCLKRKFEHIKESIQNGEDFYVLSKFIQVINSAFNLQLNEASTINEVGTALSAT